MRSLRFAISSPARLDAGAISWLLAQTLWVGGLWLLHFVLLPAISKSGLASLLVEDLSNSLRPLLVGLAAVCVGLQVVVLVRAQGVKSLWRDLRGQLLLVVLVMAASFLLQSGFALAQQLQIFSYLVMAFAGMLLVLQPLPRPRAK